jgi:hypothetical protein
VPAGSAVTGDMLAALLRGSDGRGVECCVWDFVPDWLLWLRDLHLLSEIRPFIHPKEMQSDRSLIECFFFLSL